MAIQDLQPKQGNVDIVVEVVSKEEPREFQKFGKAGRVCNAVIKDDTGEMKLTLWNEQIDKVKVGDKLQIKNGYVNEWQGEKQLTTGKFGTLEIAEKGEGTSSKKPARHKTQSEPDTTEEQTEEQLDIEEERIE
ncbi:MAG: OB-fold nucleic acid binding domain-containing protein [Candidatus Woesearchaeota archaeon]